MVSAALLERHLTVEDVVATVREAVRARRTGRLTSHPRWSVPVGPGRLVFTVGGYRSARGSAGFRVYHADTSDLDAGAEITAVFTGVRRRLRGLVVGPELGEWRTGALGAIAIDLLAPRGARTLGVLGTGRQARTHALAALSVRRFDRVLVHSRSAARRRAFVDTIQRASGVAAIATATARQTVEAAEVLVLATSSPRPVLRESWLREGVLVNQIGPKLAHDREAPLALYEGARVLVTDSLEQLRSLGAAFVLAGSMALDNLRELHELLHHPPARRRVSSSAREDS